MDAHPFDGATDARVDTGPACNAVPPPECLDGTTLVTYAGPGELVAGVCTYPSVATSCPDWCAGDACCGPCHSCAWAIEVVDATGVVGRYTSLRLDPEGGLHLAYQDETGGALKYAHRSGGGAWAIEVADVGVQAEHTSLAVGASGEIYVAYQDASSGYIKLALRDPVGLWATEIVDDATGTGDFGPHPSLGLDAQGNLHLTYEHTGTGWLRYASRGAQATWSFEDIAQVWSVFYPAQQTQADGTVHVVFSEVPISPFDPIELTYGVRAPMGGWTLESFNPQCLSLGGHGAMAVGPDGTVHVLNTDTSDCEHVQYYAYRPAAGSWTIVRLGAGQPSVASGLFSSLTTDPGSGVHATYAYADATALCHVAYGYRPPGGAWDVQTVDAADEVCGYTSVAVAPSGEVHVSYYDFPNADLKAAHLPGICSAPGL